MTIFGSPAEDDVVESLDRARLNIDDALDKLIEYTPPTPEVEKCWDDFWKYFCTFNDGSINLEQIKKELSDYRKILRNVGKVYCHVTGGRVSKPNTCADSVISEADDRVRELVEEEVNEVRDEMRTNILDGRLFF
jgi:hypothetical protein